MKKVNANKLRIVIGVSCLLLCMMDGFSICLDRSGPSYLNTGYCTVDPDYWGGQQFCKPGGFTCDGQSNP